MRHLEIVLRNDFSMVTLFCNGKEFNQISEEEKESEEISNYFTRISIDNTRGQSESVDLL